MARYIDFAVAGKAVTATTDGSLTVEVDAPEGPSGFFRVKLVE